MAESQRVGRRADLAESVASLATTREPSFFAFISGSDWDGRKTTGRTDMIFRRETIEQLADDRVRFATDLPQAGEERAVDAGIELPADAALWRDVDEIRAELYLPSRRESSDANETIRCEVTLDGSTPGFDYNDGYWFSALVSERAGNTWKGWRPFRFPRECFYTRGIPGGGWSDVKEARINGPRGSKIRNIRLVARDVRPGPRMTDEALVRALDTDYPGLESVSASESTDDNLNRIAAYFRAASKGNATGDRNTVIRRALPKLRDTTPSGPADAEEVLAGRIRGYDWSGGIDWDANPAGYIEWSIRTHTLMFVRPLIGSWWATRRSRFARGIANILTDWVRRNPIPYGLRACGLAWGHSLVVATRTYEILVEAFAALCACDETEDRCIIDVLKSLWEHANYLIAFESFPPSNKTIAEGRSLAAIGCAVPEFREARSWRRIGYSRLDEDMRIQVLDDGASYELSPGYQIAIASWFLEAYETGKRFTGTEGRSLKAGIEKMFRWSAAITRPDFTRPSISDAGSLDAKYGVAIEKPGRLLDDDHLVWIGTEGREGSVPPYRSIALRDSGYFVMRSGWDRNDVYLLFEGGPFGKFHQHEDMLTIDVYAYGSPFIVDPGISSYFQNAWTTWYRTTQAHNTVLVDGCGQSRRSFQSQTEWTESCRSKTVWRSDDGSDIAVATYDGPFGADRAHSFRHTRSVIFIKPDYFIIFDELIGDGTHTYEALFHFMPYRVLIDSKSVRTGRLDQPNIEILPLTDLEPRLVCGRNEPVQGWVSMGAQDVPAPVAIFATEAELPIRTGYVIAPFPAGRPTAEISAQVDADSDGWRVRVERSAGTDEIGMDWSGSGPRLAHDGR